MTIDCKTLWKHLHPRSIFLLEGLGNFYEPFNKHLVPQAMF